MILNCPVDRSSEVFLRARQSGNFETQTHPILLSTSALHASSGNNLWVVGLNGLTARFDGSDWQVHTQVVAEAAEVDFRELCWEANATEAHLPKPTDAIFTLALHLQLLERCVNMTDAKQLVVVTGATGFIAKYCILDLLRAGYRVRGTYRSEAKRAGLLEALAKSADVTGLELVRADLSADAGWDEALSGAQFVLHVASPLPPAPPQHEDELIAPARDGTLRILRMASKQGIKRVVMTSSIAAVVVRHTDALDTVYDETAWSEVTKLTGAYEKSKTLAERAAWDFVQALPADEKIELVTINPAIVLGPLLDRTFSTSLELVKKLLGREVPGCARLGFSIVDVRDVASLHLLAMQSEVASGKRFIGSGGFLTCVEVAEILAQHFGPRGYKVPTRILPNWLVHVVAWFDKTVRLTLPELDRRRKVSSEQARTLLGWQPRSVRETVIATGESMIEHGLV